jgi:GAF domain-containing protein
VSYMGAPVHGDVPDISTGAICVVDRHERRWSEDEVAIILLAAQACNRVFQIKYNT